MNNYFNKLINKYSFPPLVWYLILQTALARSAYFLVMPFIAIKMQDIPSTTASEIGLVLGIGPLVGTLAGFYVGYLSDLWGRQKILSFALLLWAFIFVGFAHAKTSLEFSFLMIFNGLARAAYEPVASALISDLCKKVDQSGEILKKAFHLRYLMINLGAAVAPPLGALIYLSNPLIGFYLTASIYFLSTTAFWYFSTKLNLKMNESLIAKTTLKFKQVLKVLSQDKILQLYLFANFLLSLAFSQIDFSLALELKKGLNDEGVKLFAKLLSLNGFIIVFITLPLLEWTKKFDLHLMCAISCLFWAGGYIAFAFASNSNFYYLGMILITLGEIIVFANGNYLIERLAPENMKGAYLGSLNLGFAGVILGPIIGGYILQELGGNFLFILCGVLMIFVAFIYLRVKNRVSLV
jgi:MFS family permease